MTNQTLPQGVNTDFVKLVNGVYYDLCVICEANTGVRTDTPVEQRAHYVEGCGQLCKGCYNKTDVA